jgi:hypothetical protein
MWKYIYYFCIPNGNSDLNQKYYNGLDFWDKSITTPYAYMMSIKFVSMMTKYVEIEKKAKEIKLLPIAISYNCKFFVLNLYSYTI